MPLTTLAQVVGRVSKPTVIRRMSGASQCRAVFSSKNLPTGPGDKLSLDATYTEGAPKYIIGGVTGNGFDSFSGGDGGFYNGFAFAGLFDGVYGNGTSIEKTKVWGFRGAFVHNWTPNWETSVFGSYSHVDYNGNASALICNRLAITAGAAVIPGSTCNPDFNIWQVGSRTAGLLLPT